MPSFTLPKKSIPSSSILPRSTAAIEKREQHASSASFESPPTASLVYKSLREFLERIGKLKLGACWHILSSESLVTISSYSTEHLIPKYEIFVESSLRFSLRVFGWMLTEDHDIYTKYERSFGNVTLTSFIQELQHKIRFYFQDLDSGLKMRPKLASDHFNLTPFSVMRVHLAAQVLSNTVGVCLEKFGPPEAAGTAKFCIVMDKFFDCLNVKNAIEHISKKKPFPGPYSSIDDSRYPRRSHIKAWLDEFLEYFSEWKRSGDEREGEFTANARRNMFLSWQTHEGLLIN